jgi:murein DD-endopeptidase MepM/ murein hydrolase activator NlpD
VHALASAGDDGLDHGKRGFHRLSGAPDLIDLGNEPPLSVDGGTGVTVDRRRISAQWFSGTILTGLCGAALMGGAVFTSLDGEAHFAAMPERADNALRGAIADRAAGPRKGDRLPPPGEANGRRHVLRDSITSRMGNREVVRVRPFVSVSANLSLTVSELSANIPPFNPQKMLSDSGADGALAADETPGAAPDAEVSFVHRELSALMPRMKVASLLPVDEVIQRVRETANWPGGRDNAKSYAVAGIGPAGQLAFAAEGNPDPYVGFEARIVPENITLLPKTAQQTTGGNSWNERIVTVRKGESISTILRDLGAGSDEVKAVAAALGPRGRDGGLKEGHKLRILLSAIAGGQLQQPVRVIVANETVVEAVVALSDRGKYVSVDVNSIKNTEVASADDEDDDGSGVRLYQSIYETALRNQIPRAVVDEMIRVYSYDVDFQRKAQAGDSFEVLYAGEEETPGIETKNEILFATLTVAGETKKFYRFQTPDDNVVDYYDETGKSAKKFLVRKPLSDGLMRSGFGVRRHPILGYMKMHTGVDWTAPHGTPIFASGNGIVDKVGWESGYGKYVKIRHANGYETAYGHMTAFARSIDPGTRVRQGQIIGFVGSTGLSTGSHLHYEILVNGRFVDPMRIRLPRGRVLENNLLAGFEKERDRLDAMMARVPSSRVAQNTPEAGSRR